MTNKIDRVMDSRYLALFISAAYILAVALWFLFVDRFLTVLLHQYFTMQIVNAFRYWSIVGITAAMLYTLVQYQLAYRMSKVELAKSEVKLKELFDHANDMIFTFHIRDDQIYLKDINKLLIEKLGYSMHEFQERSFSDISVTQHAQNIANVVNRLKQEGAVTFKWIYRTSVDESIPVDISMCIYTLQEETIGLAIARDLTERQENDKKIKSALRAYEDIKFALDQSTIVSITDASGAIQYANDMFCKISKFSREELIDQNHRMINSGYHSKEFFQNMWQTISSGRVWKGEIRNKAKDGSIYWVNATIVPFLDDNGKPYQYITIRKDITDSKLSEEKIEYLAYHDSLTGLPNRFNSYQHLHRLISKTPEVKQPFAVMFLDLDRFKYINDSLGHTIGDRLIQLVAERLKCCFRKDDMFSRIDGDEFTATLLNVTKCDIIQITESIRRKFLEPFYIDRHELFITLSMGISLYPDDTCVVDDLLKNADMAMYAVKADGGGNYKFYTPEMDQKMSQKMILEKNLRKALDKEEFIVYYQPQVDIHTGNLLGMEALVRWNHPEWGIVPPTQFIPIAEETGLIVAIGEQVLKQACRQNKAWQDAGMPPVRVAVNLSAEQFKQKDFVDRVIQIIEQSGLDPKFLELEITEGIALQNSQNVVQSLLRLVDFGIQIAIDDFGTGYCSLNYLRKYPIKNLKIDRSFIKDIHVNTDDAAIIKAIIQMAKSLKLTVIAEGVETKEQLYYLRKHECDVVQGYIFGKPVPAKEFVKFLKKGCIYSAS